MKTDCWNIQKFATDLSTLLKLIDTYELPLESSRISNLESQFQYSSSFSVSIEDIAFTIRKKISGTIPADIDKIVILFSNKFEFDSSKDCNTYDPIKNYSFQIQIKGYNQSLKEHVYWWHLDKNIKSSSPKFTHPYYHFQAGGNDLEIRDSGELILMGAPRLPHPPMDVFLGVHFIINNFLSVKDYPSIKNLLNNYEYQEVIKTAQERMWNPYFMAFANNNQNLDFTFENIFPLYVK